jgi:SAM-dependent methyltransferase
MTDAALSIVLDATTACLKRFLRGRSGMDDPAGYTRCRWLALSAATGAVIHHALSGLLEPGPKAARIRPVLQALSRQFGPGSVFEAAAVWCEDYADLLDPVVSRLRELPPDQIRIGEVYEQALAYELHALEGRPDPTTSSVDRHRMGSYYTPTDLADACVDRVVRRLLEQRLGIQVPSSNVLPASQRKRALKLLCTARVVDFSCGVGRFLLSYLRVVQGLLAPGPLLRSIHTEETGLLLEIARNLYGVDVDPIALEVTRAELVIAVGRGDLLEALRANFRHRNPLLLAREDVGPARRREHFLQGFIYHSELGIPPDEQDAPFDVVLGNPPWERLRLEERAFFEPFSSTVVTATRKDERQRAILALEASHPALHTFYTAHLKTYTEAQKSIAADPRFQFSSHGELNSYALFAELSLRHLTEDGVAGLLVKSGLFTTAVHRHFFNHLLTEGRLIAVFDFINTRRLFPIDSRERFALMLAGHTENHRVRFAMGLTSVADLAREELLTELSAETLQRLNPVTGMLPSTSSPEELDVLIRTTEHNAGFDDVYPAARFGRIVHLTAHASDIERRPAQGRIPIYEGKFIEQYDGRFAGFSGVPHAERYAAKARARPIPPEAKADRLLVPESRFFIDAAAWEALTARHREPFSLFWRNTTSASNRRTVIATILPHLPTIQSIQLVQLPGRPLQELARLLAVMNSRVFDYMVRRKLNGIDLTATVIRQIPVPAKERWDARIRFQGERASLGRHVERRVCALLRDDARLEGFCAGIFSEPAARPEERRARQREIDLLIAWAYSIGPAQLRFMCLDFAEDLSKDETEWLAADSNWPIAA